MARTFKDDPLWVRENRSPTRTRHRHWRHSCDDPQEFDSADDLRTSRMCMRASVHRKFFHLLDHRFYERNPALGVELRRLALEARYGEVDDSFVSVEPKNASLCRGGIYDW